MEARMASVRFVMINFFLQNLDPKGSGEGPSNIRLPMASSRKSEILSKGSINWQKSVSSFNAVKIVTTFVFPASTFWGCLRGLAHNRLLRKEIWNWLPQTVETVFAKLMPCNDLRAFERKCHLLIYFPLTEFHFPFTTRRHLPASLLTTVLT